MLSFWVHSEEACASPKSMMKVSGLIAICLLVSSCSTHKSEPTPNGSAALNANAPTPDYGPRVGVAVRTAARTCVAIQNSNLASGTSVVLVSPLAPQSFTPATIGGTSFSACPVTKEINPGTSSYSLDVSNNQLPRLTPLIAVVGDASAFSLINNAVQANLDQNGKVESFRACNSSDGVHLTVWQGNSLSGTVLWRGYYYDPSNAGMGPTCVPSEISGT